MTSSKASEKEVQKVLEAVANGDPLPPGYAFNPVYTDEPVWKISGAPNPDHLVPPSYRKAGAPLTGDGSPGGNPIGAETVEAGAGAEMTGAIPAANASAARADAKAAKSS